MEKLELSGTLAANLRAAVTSARRLRGHAVHSDTLAFWQALLSQSRAKGRVSDPAEGGEIETLVAELESELAVRR